MSRTPQLQKFVDNFAEKAFGHRMGDKTKEGNPVCVFCGKEIIIESEFRDDLSYREFTISGICQQCQDETFGV